LEDDNNKKYNNYGIYANGILAESTMENTLSKLNNFDLINVDKSNIDIDIDKSNIDIDIDKSNIDIDIHIPINISIDIYLKRTSKAKKYLNNSF
jgi:hypothetical protein